MKTKEVNPILRGVITFSLIVIANLALYFIFLYAPQRSLEYLSNNIWVIYVVTGIFELSTIPVTIGIMFPELKLLRGQR